MEKVSDFYASTIGLTRDFGDEKFVAFKVGEARLGIKLATAERELPGAQTAILSVTKIVDWNTEMKEAGVTFYKELSDDKWGRNFSILDPDGNKVEFVEK